MLRRQRQLRTALHQIMDLGLFGLAFWLAHWLRAEAAAHFADLPEIHSFDHYFWQWALVLLLTKPFLKAQGFYNRPLLFSRRETIWTLLKVAALEMLVMVTAVFLMKEDFARSIVLLFGGLAVGLVAVKEELMRWWLVSELGREQTRRRVLLFGAAGETARIEKDLAEKAEGNVLVVERLEFKEATTERLFEMLHEHAINGVILSGGHVFFDQIERVIEVCELEGVEVWLLADFFRTQISQTTVDDFFGRPTLVFRSAPEASWQGVAKQMMDVVGAALALLVLAAPMGLAALVIRGTSGGPVFFRQRRSGLNGRPFVMWKFRTMVSNAEQRRVELEAFNEMDGPVFKVTRDPRVTRVGRWLRKYSIDEWPQLLNVLRGEMSLVGPRPLPVDEVKRIHDPAHRRRLSVKPGLTCLWQISGRNDVASFKEWVRLDLEYIDNWSLWLDLKILCKTIPVVLLGTGAR